MEKLPKDVLFQLALELDLPELYSLCRSGKKYSKICDSKDFWYQKLWKDYKVKSKDPKSTYERIVKNRKHCNNLLILGKVNPNDFILDGYTDEYFNNYNDFLVYRYLVSKLLAKDEGIPEYFEGLYDRYIERINPSLERGKSFSIEDFEEFVRLLNSLKTFGSFENSYIKRMITGEIPFDTTWGNLCNYILY